jgi:uncharacterized protein (TIGR02452 family)
MKQDNIQIFQETKQLYETDPALAEAIKASIARQKVIISPMEVERIPGKTNIILSPKRTLEAASRYKTKTAVLNFASAKNPGGGVEYGSSAQEEALCRISTLYPCLCDEGVWEDYYYFHRKQQNALYSDRLIYTPDVVVFRKDDAGMEILPKEDWWRVDVITCPAPNKGWLVDDIDLEPVFVNRFRAILASAQAHDIENVILGAYGCGAFGNDPNVVASAAKRAVGEFSFKNVEFAVYCNKWDSANYDAFSRVFSDAWSAK